MYRGFPVEIQFVDFVRPMLVQNTFELLPRDAVRINLNIRVQYLAAREKQVCRRVILDQRRHCLHALFEICAFDPLLGEFRPCVAVPVHQPDAGSVEFETPRISHG